MRRVPPFSALRTVPGDTPLFELALHTGLRKGELLGLRWEDLDLAGGTAGIRRTLQCTDSGGLTATSYSELFKSIAMWR